MEKKSCQTVHEDLFSKLVMDVSHMIYHAYWLNSSYWPHFFIRTFSGFPPHWI